MPLTGDTSTLDHYTALHYITQIQWSIFAI